MISLEMLYVCLIYMVLLSVWRQDPLKDAYVWERRVRVSYLKYGHHVSPVSEMLT